MPESKGRPRPPRAPESLAVKKPQAGPSPRWFAPVMVALFVIGLLWIVVWHLAGSSLPLMKDLGNWNMAIGFLFIIGGFMMSTRWR